MNNRINFEDATLLNTKLSAFNKELDNLYRLIELDGCLVATRYPTTHLSKQTNSVLSCISNVRVKSKAITVKLHSRDKITKIQPKLDVMLNKINKLMNHIDAYTDDITSIKSKETHMKAYQHALTKMVKDLNIAFKEL